MKKSILKTTILGLFALAVAAAPAFALEPLPVTNAPAASSEAAPVKKAKKDGPVAFSAKVGMIDTNAMTLTVGKRTLDITSETKITKDGKPAILAEGVAGETASGDYKKEADGKLSAITVNFAPKASAKKKKAPATESTGSTNSITK